MSRPRWCDYEECDDHFGSRVHLGTDISVPDDDTGAAVSNGRLESTAFHSSCLLHSRQHQDPEEVGTHDRAQVRFSLNSDCTSLAAQILSGGEFDETSNEKVAVDTHRGDHSRALNLDRLGWDPEEEFRKSRPASPYNVSTTAEFQLKVSYILATTRVQGRYFFDRRHESQWRHDQT